MQLFRRPQTDEDDEVRWLTPTQVRKRPRRRLLPFAVLTAAVVGAGALVVTSVRLSGPTPVSESERTRPPASKSAEASPPPRVEETTPQQAPIAPVPPTPAPPPAQQSAEAPDPAPEAAAPPPIAPATPAVSDVTGAFPQASAPPTEDAERADFAAYLNESAPDQTAARTLVVDAQRRYAGALGGGRLSYRRVRLNDGSYAWRLRLSGLTREGAERVCVALQGEGAGCEVGPR